MSFGLNVQFLREQAGMTQEGLAEALQVSRQSVSKWESDTCFPEMEKLLTLCQIFRVDLDTLLRKDVRESFCTDTAGYDRFMNRFSNSAALGIGLMLFSVAGGLALYGFAGLSERWLAAALISGAAVATAILMVAGMRFDRFERENPVIPDFYSREERERFLHRYPILVAAPVTAFFLAVLWLLLLGGEAEALLGQRGEAKLVSVFLLVIGVGVTALVWAVLRKGKYDIALWNRRHDPSPEAVAQRKRVGRVCGAIMLAATAVYLALGFGAMAAAGPHGGAWGWQWGCGVYPVAGVLCAMAAHLIPGGEREEH